MFWSFVHHVQVSKSAAFASLETRTKSNKEISQIYPNLLCLNGFYLKKMHIFTIKNVNTKGSEQKPKHIQLFSFLP